MIPVGCTRDSQQCQLQVLLHSQQGRHRAIQPWSARENYKGNTRAPFQSIPHSSVLNTDVQKLRAE